ncbi:hypothetical protein MMA231_04141 (plasmid) [Asticcacaulis sp. MM231]|uniref:hypothetical protein n=1 Tax=Asticcacaulis sp. MM231 TaxID=3157666 RepID=UPI0032D570A7
MLNPLSLLKARALSVVFAALLACQAVQVKAEVYPAMRSEDARATIGINTHVNYLDTTYADFPAVLRALDYVGVDHIRELTPMPWLSGAAPLGYYDQLMRAGLNIDFVVPGGKVDLVKSILPVIDLAKGRPGKISAIEGFNEVDHAPVTFGGETGPGAAVAAQKQLFSIVRSHEVLKDIPVYDLTGVMPLPTSLAGRADYGNAHLYPQNGYPPDGWFRGMKDLASASKLPMVVTEFGYASMPERGWLVVGVDEAGQAKGILSGIFSGIENGFARTYLYQLFDEKPDPNNADREWHFGLYDVQYRKKISAVALHNLTTLLADARPDARSFVTQPLDLKLSGLPEKAHIVVLQKADRRYLVALWSEQVFWDHVEKTPKATKVTPVRVTLPAGVTSARLYDPLLSEAPTDAVMDKGELVIPVPDHPVLLELMP